MLGEPYGPFQKRLSGAYPDHHLRPDDLARVVELVRGPAVRKWFEQVYGVVSYQPVPVPAKARAMSPGLAPVVAPRSLRKPASKAKPSPTA